MRHLIYFIGIVVALCVLTGCRTTRIVEVPVVHTEYIRHDSIVRDSIRQLDSVFVLVKGDTVYKEKYKYVYKDRFLLLHDTLSSVDTLTVVKEVEKRMKPVQQAYIALGKTFLSILTTAFIILVFWLILHKKH